MPSLVTERIESVKAGIFGAGAFILAEIPLLMVAEIIARLLPELSLTSIIIDQQSELTSSFYGGIIFDWTWVIELAIGAISGFLFGVTYRYVIRSDRNSHLNDGAVLAFGLVRGLALVEKNLVGGNAASSLLSELLSVGGLVLQSIICFAIARLILDVALTRKLIKPFV